MDILIIRHSALEGLGSIASWCVEHEHNLIYVHPYAGDSMFQCVDVDALIVMGGPQSVLSIDQPPYLVDEIEFIQAAVNHKKKVLGVCLGAQLIAYAYGAKTEPSPYTELGFYPITLTPEGQKDTCTRHLPDKFIVGHWHYDMLGLPRQATVLAQSAGCPRQIVRFDQHVLGLQCHMEMTYQHTQAFIKLLMDGYKPGPFVQSTDYMLQTDFELLTGYMHNLLKHFFNES